MKTGSGMHLSRKLLPQASAVLPDVTTTFSFSLLYIYSSISARRQPLMWKERTGLLPINYKSLFPTPNSEVCDDPLNFNNKQYANCNNKQMPIAMCKLLMNMTKLWAFLKFTSPLHLPQNCGREGLTTEDKSQALGTT